MKLDLVRLAVIYFRANIPSFAMEFGDVEVKTISAQEHNGGRKLFVAGTCPLAQAPSLVGDLVVVPEEPRRNIEQAIESAANLFAVCQRTQRQIRSPLPHIAFVPGDEEATAWLAGVRGFSRQPVNVPIPRFTVDIGVYTQLQDRLDGVALLAEAFAHEHQTGRFHECVRLFERAFGRANAGLVSPMAAFLSGTPFKFTKKEINDWVVDKRDRSTHADRKDFLLEADIQPIMRRVEEAALDVLFNKVEWQTPSAARGSYWKPSGGTTPTGAWVYQYTAEGAIAAASFDMFQSYPLDGTVFNSMPSPFWVPPNSLPDASRQVGGGGFKIDVIPRPSAEST